MISQNYIINIISFIYYTDKFKGFFGICIYFTVTIKFGVLAKNKM